MNWKTANYLTHRWLGITLGAMTFTWFASGVAMIFYPWPAPTASEELARLRPFALPDAVIGFDSAIAIGRAISPVHGPDLGRARLVRWNDRLVYSLAPAASAHQPLLLVDAATGRIQSPIGREDAVAVARTVARNAAVRSVERLDAGDHYLLSSEYRAGFPAYVVRFDDADRTAVYVSEGGGNVVGVVTNRTRWTTWLGTVPHWLYFKWLYTRHIGWWLWVSYVLPGIAMVAGVSGVLIGLHQLLPHWRRGQWRISAYHGASQWHHLAGVVFGAVVIVWSFSGLLEVLGPDASPTAAQRAVVRGAEAGHVAVDELRAVRIAAAAVGAEATPVAVERVQVLGEPGYVVNFPAGRRVHVDAITGAVRGEITASVAGRIASLALGHRASVRSVHRITKYDAYYYARFHRELPLPAWRVAFDDAERSVLYVDPLAGEPIGFVDGEVRRYRWLRDGLHSLDFPALNERRLLWLVVILPLMLGGTVLAGTGMWLAIRRARRMVITARTRAASA